MVYHMQPTAANFASLKDIQLQTTEGVLYAKFVLLTQRTLNAGEAAAKAEAAPAVIMMGDLEQLKSQLVEFFDQAIKAYRGTLS
jgi:hypothetical protein